MQVDGLNSKNHKNYNIMKKLVLLVLIFTTLSLTAQERKGQHKGQNGPDGMEMFKDLTPSESATLQTKRMTLDLNLTESQQKELYTLNLKNAERRQAKRAEMEQNKEGDQDKKPSKKDRIKFMNERLDNQIAHKKDMQRILDQDQFEKWERHSKRKGHHKGQKQKNKSHRSKRSR